MRTWPLAADSAGEVNFELLSSVDACCGTKLEGRGGCHPGVAVANARFRSFIFLFQMRWDNMKRGVAGFSRRES